MDASIIQWIFPRAKNSPPDCFYTSLRTGAALSNPISNFAIKQPPPCWVGVVLWRSRRDLNPRYPFGVHTIASRARYDHFDTAPGQLLRDSLYILQHFSPFVNPKFLKFANYFCQGTDACSNFCPSERREEAAELEHRHRGPSTPFRSAQDDSYHSKRRTPEGASGVCLFLRI